MGPFLRAEHFHMKDHDEHPFDRTEIAFRRRALHINAGIHARRNGPALLPVLSGAGIRARYMAQMAWLGSEADWRDADARRIDALAAEIARFGRDGAPEIAEACAWHAARLRELVGQHAALRRLEAEQGPASPWPDTAARRSRRLGASGRSGARR
jgi:hypothetical protein